MRNHGSGFRREFSLTVIWVLVPYRGRAISRQRRCGCRLPGSIKSRRTMPHQIGWLMAYQIGWFNVHHLWFVVDYSRFYGVLLIIYGFMVYRGRAIFRRRRRGVRLPGSVFRSTPLLSLVSPAVRVVLSGWEGFRESRRYSRDNYPESYITKST